MPDHITENKIFISSVQNVQCTEKKNRWNSRRNACVGQNNK